MLSSPSASVTCYTDLLSDFQTTQYVTAPSKVTDCPATLFDHLLAMPILSVSCSNQTISLSDHHYKVLEIDILVVRPIAMADPGWQMPTSPHLVKEPAMLLIKIATKLYQAKVSLSTYENMHILLAFITNSPKTKVKLAVKLSPSTFVHTKRL